MKLADFILLGEDERIAVLWREANIIAERKDRGYNVFLYQIYSFYIEVWHSCNLKDKYKLRSFSGTEELEPYLQKIDISNLFTNIEN